MKLIKWILSHGVLVVIVALVALGIYFRTDLFPEYFAQREPAVAPAVTSQPQTQPAPEAQPVSEPSSGAGIAVTEPPATVEPEVAATAVPAGATQEPAATEAAPEPVSTEPMSATPAAAAQPQPLEPVPAEPAAAVTETAAAPAEPVGENAGKLRNDARQAFWRGDYDQAVAHYESLADLDPQDPDPYGELGNVYFGQGKWAEAAAAYLEAGKRLVATDRIGQAIHLQRILVGLDAGRAQELQQAIDQARGAAASAN